MTPNDVATFAVPLMTAVILGTYAAYWTAHNVAVERARWIGARPIAPLPAEDVSLRRRYERLRAEQYRKAAA